MDTTAEIAFRAQAEHESITHTLTGVAVLQDSNVLMVRRAAGDYLGGYYELPGGGVDEGETIATLRTTPNMIACMQNVLIGRHS